MATAIIGVGNIGSVLAANLVRGGEDVVLASRDLKHAQAVADNLGACAAPVDEAIATANVVILAVWFDVSRELLASYHHALDGKVIVDPSNAVTPDGEGGFAKTISADESAGQILAALVPPHARIVKAFGTQTAHTLATSSGRQPLTAQFYATDDQAAGEAVAKLIRTAGYAPIRVGGIDQSMRRYTSGRRSATASGPPNRHGCRGLAAKHRGAERPSACARAGLPPAVCPRAPRPDRTAFR